MMDDLFWHGGPKSRVPNQFKKIYVLNLYKFNGKQQSDDTGRISQFWPSNKKKKLQKDFKEKKGNLKS